jgi:hypothetical protein
MTISLIDRLAAFMEGKGEKEGIPSGSSRIITKSQVSIHHETLRQKKPY